MARADGAFLPSLAAVAILVGVFAPLADVEVYGSISLFDISETQGLLLLAVAAATLLVVFSRAWRRLPLCALAAWAALFYPLLQRWLTPRDDSPFGQIKDAFSKAASDAFGDVATDVVMDVTHVRWGGVVLVGGCILLTVVAVRRR
jgi:hypothetical protein